MPICMWASTQPGNARKLLASNISLACDAWMSGARRAIRPSVIAMSRQSTDVLLGRTTRAFLITRSNDWSMVSPAHARLGVGRLRRGFISPAERQQFFRADQAVDPVEIEHAGAERLGRPVADERGIVFACRAGQRAHDAT